VRGKQRPEPNMEWFSCAAGEWQDVFDPLQSRCLGGGMERHQWRCCADHCPERVDSDCKQISLCRVKVVEISTQHRIYYLTPCYWHLAAQERASISAMWFAAKIDTLVTLTLLTKEEEK
jgi:hypothetical protein